MTALKSPEQTKAKDFSARQTKDSTPNSERPLFCFFHFKSRDKRLGLRALNDKNLTKPFLDHLLKMSQQSWNELLLKRKQDSGFEYMPENDIPKTLPLEFRKKKDTKFLKIRFKDQHPVIGVRRGRIFHIVWVDPYGDLYSHGS